MDKSYKPVLQTALDLGLDPNQTEEMARITEATARKHMKQKDGSACPTVYVPLNESQTGRYFSEIVREQRAKIDVLQARVADLKAGNSSWQSQYQTAVNEKTMLQDKFDRQLAENEELRARLEAQNDRLRQADVLILQLSGNVVNLRNRLRALDEVGEASFRNHQNCRCAVEIVNLKHQAPTLVINDFGRPHPIVNTKFNDGDKWVDMAGQETFTFFRGEWRRQSELEGFAFAQKYL